MFRIAVQRSWVMGTRRIQSTIAKHHEKCSHGGVDHLFAANKTWSESMRRKDPDFFQRLVAQQEPQYLWIGCSDSRVPANQIIDLDPGQVFVHRNGGNIVVHSDLNMLSVLQFAVDVLKVKHVLVVGHYGCVGVRSAFLDIKLGLVDNWLRHIQDVRDAHLAHLEVFKTEEHKLDRMCELNVIEQVMNVGRTTIMKDAWSRGQDVKVHGWCYKLTDGLIRDMGMSSQDADQLLQNYNIAIKSPKFID